jgi:predicted nucleotidyltransferase
MSEQMEMMRIRDLLRHRRAVHRERLWREVERLAAAAAELGVQRVVLFGSLLRDRPGLTSDVDLLMVWDTPLDFVERVAELYRLLQPRVAADLLAYTPEELERAGCKPFVRRALLEGKVLYEAPGSWRRCDRSWAIIEASLDVMCWAENKHLLARWCYRQNKEIDKRVC